MSGGMESSNQLQQCRQQWRKDWLKWEHTVVLIILPVSDHCYTYMINEARLPYTLLIEDAGVYYGREFGLQI